MQCSNMNSKMCDVKYRKTNHLEFIVLNSSVYFHQIRLFVFYFSIVISVFQILFSQFANLFKSWWLMNLMQFCRIYWESLGQCVGANWAILAIQHHVDFGNVFENLQPFSIMVLKVLFAKTFQQSWCHLFVLCCGLIFRFLAAFWRSWRSTFLQFESRLRRAVILR